MIMLMSRFATVTIGLACSLSAEVQNVFFFLRIMVLITKRTNVSDDGYS